MIYAIINGKNIFTINNLSLKYTFNKISEMNLTVYDLENEFNNLTDIIYYPIQIIYNDLCIFNGVIKQVEKDYDNNIYTISALDKLYMLKFKPNPGIRDTYINQIKYICKTLSCSYSLNLSKLTFDANETYLILMPKYNKTLYDCLLKLMKYGNYIWVYNPINNCIEEYDTINKNKIELYHNNIVETYVDEIINKIKAVNYTE